MSDMFTIPNLLAQQVTVKRPWEFAPSVPETAKVTKAAYREWLTQPATQHCLYSCVEGAVAGMRISADNPITKIHGLVVDYDTVISDELLVQSLRDCPGEFRPNWVHSTPNSGGRRLIWLFQTPVPVASLDMARIFLNVAAKKLRAKNFLPGLDTEALGNPTIYYDVGVKWQELDTARVPETFLFSWLFDTGALVDRQTFEGPVIPLGDVQKEMEMKFPGRWIGEFVLGSSGPRFWDASSDNPRACVVNRFGTGMHCFTGGVSFMPWVAIFGPIFVEKYKAETLGAVMAGTWFDGQSYWRKAANGQWFAWQKDDYRLYLKVHHQLSIAKQKGRASTELDDVVHSVNEQKRVVGAFPYIYLPDGPITVDHESFLNISTVQVLPPASDTGTLAWGEGFPWLADFLVNFFPEEKVRTIFLGWLQRAYVPAYHHAPTPGQVVLLAGDVSRGKSLLSTVIVSRMLGGSADASKYFLGEEDFSYHILRKPLMTVDDEVPASSVTRHTRYSAMLKKIVANGEHTYERKFKDSGKITWLGRVMITCNMDSESIRLLPNMELSDADKISLFRCNSAAVYPFKFPDRKTISDTVDRELPSLCRWLMQWELPENLRGDPRWGVVHYHDTMLMDSSIHTGESFSFMEVLQIFLRSYRNVHPEATFWKGTASDLFSQMGLDEGIKPLLSRYNAGGAAKYLGQLKSRGFALEPVHTKLQRLWRISMTLIDTETNEPETPEEVKIEDK